MATAGDAERRENESVWTRIQRQESDYAARARRPLALALAGLLLLNLTNFARMAGVALSLTFDVITFVVGLTMAVVGLVKALRTRKGLGL